jgi:hypothetical protein
MTDNNGLRAALANAHNSLELYHAYGWPDRGGVRAALRVQIDALAATQPPARCTGLTDMGFILDAANKGELAAYDYAAQNMCVAVWEILNGKDTGHGICNEPWQSLRVQLLELVKEAQQQSAQRAEVRPLVLTADAVESIALRKAWKYKHSSDPHHSDTYTFNRTCLLDFVTALGVGITSPSAADSAQAGAPPQAQGQQQGAAR